MKPLTHQINIRYTVRGRTKYKTILARQEGDKIFLKEQLFMKAPEPFPHIVVTGAAYGHPTDGGQR